VTDTPPIDAILDWLTAQALKSVDIAELFEACCLRLHAVGIPVTRGHLAFRELNPLYDGRFIRWRPGETEENAFDRGSDERQDWQTSPFAYMLSGNQTFLRRRLSGPTASLDFPVLESLAAEGGTEYIAHAVSFDGGWRRGIVTSWVTERAGGFSLAEIAALERVVHHLAIAVKSQVDGQLGATLARTYVGHGLGETVLQGLIKRGDGRREEAALWYSDLRDSAGLSERMEPEAFLELLNRYFDATAGAVLDAGGEVVTLIGDAVLSLFRGAPGEACAAALSAARDARRRLTEINGGDVTPLRLGIALHYDHLVYGNIGTETRLQMTMVGAAVNKVVRLEGLTKSLGYPLLASQAFADLAQADWQDLGCHELRGIEEPMPVRGLADPPQSPA